MPLSLALWIWLCLQSLIFSLSLSLALSVCVFVSVYLLCIFVSAYFVNVICLSTTVKDSLNSRLWQSFRLPFACVRACACLCVCTYIEARSQVCTAAGPIWMAKYARFSIHVNVLGRSLEWAAQAIWSSSLNIYDQPYCKSIYNIPKKKKKKVKKKTQFQEILS